MKRNWSNRMAVILAGTATLAPLAPAFSAEAEFTLARAVPADVFLCITGRHNPERDFLTTYWNDVFAAAKESGIGDDLMAMFSEAVGSEQIDEFNRLKARALELLNGVNWDALFSGEMVFAERMHAPQIQGSSVNMGPPDFLWLARGQNAEQNFNGLVALVEGALEEIRKAGGPDAANLALARGELHGAQVASIVLAEAAKHGINYRLAIARRGDLIAVTFGDRILDEILTLAAGDGSGSIAQAERYRNAFTQLPAPEDSKVFFDVQVLLKTFQGLVAAIEKEAGGADDVVVNARNEGPAHELNAQALQAYRAGDAPKALELIRQAAEADPKDSRILYNLACFNSINGNKEDALGALTRAVNAGFYSPEQIAADADLESLRETPEFKQAVAIAKEQAAKHGSTERDAIKGVIQRLMDVPGMFDYVASVGYTEGYSTHSQTVVTLMPGAEQKPFYPVITAKTDHTGFDRFLPEETESFSVSGGFDLTALYGFVQDTFKAAGREGEQAWAQWEAWQQQTDFDVNKNVLGWLGSDTISVTLANHQGSVLMVKVKDEAVAREKVGKAVEFLSTKLVEAAAQNPMLAMMSVRKSPVQHEKLQGFENLFIGMSPEPVVWGVAGGHLIFADKADAVALCLDTAAGAHPNVRKNARVMAEAIVPDGAFTSVSLTDQRALGQQVAAALGMVSMFSGMASMGIPDPDAKKVIGKIAGLLMKLTPVVTKIDFYKSVASHTTFDGKAWHMHMVTHYVSPEERTASAK